MKSSDAHAFLDDLDALETVLPKKGLKEKSKAIGYKTRLPAVTVGREIALELIRKSDGFRFFIENSFDPSSIGLSAHARYEPYPPEERRSHIGRIAPRLAGPKGNQKGADAWCFWLTSESDLRSVIDAYLKT
jgi:hypothetical protein